MRWLEARRRRAELVPAVTADVERAKAVFGRLLLIRSVGELRVLCGLDKVRGAFPDWTYLAVTRFFIRCRYSEQIAMPSEQDRVIARELALAPHLDLDRDLTSVQQALQRVVDAYTSASVSFNVTEIYKDPDLPFDERASARRYGDLAGDERRLNESICALPDVLPDTALASQLLDDALRAAVRKMGSRDIGYSPYATHTSWDADRWPQWLATELVRRTATQISGRPAEAPISGTLASLLQ
jgi:hypothetical protein